MAGAEESIWFSTRSALFRPGDAAWMEIAAYAEPLRRLLDRRYSWLAHTDRDDLVQEILVEIRTTLAARHDRSRGPFRALLQTVVSRRVADLLRRRRPEQLDAEVTAAPEPEEVLELELEAALLAAVAVTRDRFTQGPEKDLAVLYALVDRIVHGLSSAEIAARSGQSPGQVARLLERGRDAIFEALLARELELSPGPRLTVARDAFKASLRRPSAAGRALDALGDRALAASLEAFLDRFRSGLRHFEGDETASGRELRRGLSVILEEAAP
jgi:DNA-directed RNA polymerase specialized sigma24 family protein